MKGGIPLCGMARDLKRNMPIIRSGETTFNRGRLFRGFKNQYRHGRNTEFSFVTNNQRLFFAVGIEMEIRTMDSEAWVAFCRASRKYDQMSTATAQALGMVSEPLNHLERFGRVPANIRWLMTRFLSLSIIARLL